MLDGRPPVPRDRLRSADARRLYEHTAVGTKVTITGSGT
ncbi:L,D-transpeptidase [Streptomyces argyrophylli]|uniref:L,D-transpeptidase n=1 Tax=Streptomyces argyrophylli TaxID=2726118 RepID=A0A6M4PI67_9ACTN|nr:L,D-transpeptidase [Streptomyces argyrophyllae]QJS10938.1 L,D-transpeptidase [Streptomyces argyrophyllae]